MTDRDVDELLGPITDRWKCRRCGEDFIIPSFARECEIDHLDYDTDERQP